jgi:hypothetical protein
MNAGQIMLKPSSCAKNPKCTTRLASMYVFANAKQGMRDPTMIVNLLFCCRARSPSARGTTVTSANTWKEGQNIVYEISASPKRVWVDRLWQTSQTPKVNSASAEEARAELRPICAALIGKTRENIVVTERSHCPSWAIPQMIFQTSTLTKNRARITYSRNAQGPSCSRGCSQTKANGNLQLLIAQLVSISPSLGMSRYKIHSSQYLEF